MNPTAAPVTVVLVHGAVHGAWCWDRVTPLLEADARVGSVRAVDLPGHGANRSVPDDDITLDDYVGCVLDAAGADETTPILLVGHSLAGITITPAAHRLGGRLRHLVYLTTICPPAGSSVADLLATETRPEYRMGTNMPDMFCTDFTDDEREWLVSRLGGEPAGPFNTPASIETPPADVPATYIVCERDEALSAVYQHEQAARVGADVVSLDAGHSPFVTHVDELTALLLDRL